MSTPVVAAGQTDTIPAQRTAPSVEKAALIAPTEIGAPAQHHMLGVRLELFDSVPDAAARLTRRAAGGSTGLAVFTCNVDHLMLIGKDEEFRRAYQRADAVTIDGAPLALLSRWTGSAQARRVTGVELTAALVDVAAQRGLRVALVGGADGHGAEAAARLRAARPTLPELFVDSPRMGFALGDAEDERLVNALRAYSPDIVIVCLGAPKQELWIDRHRDELPGAVLVGAGATIDFLSGNQSRAPRIVQRSGLEALYRLVTDFRRLWRRYLLRDTRFLMLFTTIMLTHVLARGGLRTRPIRCHPGALDTVAKPSTARCCVTQHRAA